MRIIVLLIFCITSISNAQKKDVFLLIGQSNMAGRGHFESSTDSLPINDVFLLNANGEFEAAKNPLNRFSTIRKVCEPELQRVGLGASFSKKMAEFTKDSVYLIVNARGGTPINKFLKGSDDGYYESILNRTKNVLEKNDNLRLRAILWHQGESNANDADNYLEKLQKMVTDFRADFEMPDLPFIAGELGEWNQNYKIVRKEIEKIPETIENSYLVSSKNLKNMDDHHFNTSSYYKLGKRYAETWIKILNK